VAARRHHRSWCVSTESGRTARIGSPLLLLDEIPRRQRPPVLNVGVPPSDRIFHAPPEGRTPTGRQPTPGWPRLTGDLHEEPGESLCFRILVPRRLLHWLGRAALFNSNLWTSYPSHDYRSARAS